MNAIFASLDHLTAGHSRNKAAVDATIDAIVSAHQHGAKDAFDDRVDALRSALINAYAIMDAVCDTARTAVGMPAGSMEAGVEAISSGRAKAGASPTPVQQEAVKPSPKT